MTPLQLCPPSALSRCAAWGGATPVGDLGGLCPAWPGSLGLATLRLYSDLSGDPNLGFFWTAGPGVFIFSDKKLGIRQGGVETMILLPLLSAAGFTKAPGWRVSLEARPGPAAPHSLQSDLGDAAMRTGSLHPHPNSGAWSQPGVTPEPRGGVETLRQAMGPAGDPLLFRRE